MKRLFAVVAAAGSLAACQSVMDNVINRATNSASDAVASNVAGHVGAAVSRALPPPPQGAVAPGAGVGAVNWSGPLMAQMMTYYTNFIFGLAFGSGGYEVTTVEYKPGQYTRWVIPSNKDEGRSESTLERAFLFADKDHNQWWKVKFTDGKDKSTIILEALLDPKGQKMLRLRGKFPNDTEGKEMAVTENTYYVPPTRLTQQSIEGAKQGSESVQVPAGTFTAEKVVFGDAASTHTWWLYAKVPGGSVKQQMKGSGNGETDTWTMQLAAFGNDAKSELGVH